MVSSSVGTAEGFQEVNDQPLCLRRSTRAATAMDSHIPAVDVPPHSGVGREGHPLRLKHPLGVEQLGCVLWVPQEDAQGQLLQEGLIQLVTPDSKRRIRCQMSSRTTSLSHSLNTAAALDVPWDEQQSRST